MSDSIVIRDYPSVTTRECGITVKSFRSDWSDSCFQWHKSYLDFDDIHSGRTATEGEMPFVVIVMNHGIYMIIVSKKDFFILHL